VTGVQTCALPISPKPQNPMVCEGLEYFQRDKNIFKFYITKSAIT